MSVTTTYSFDDAANFTLSNAQVSGSKAILGLVNNPGQSFIQDFSSSSGFTVVAGAAEVSGGQLQQVDQTPADSILGSSFDTKDANWNKADTTTGTLQGSPTISGGVVSCTGDQGISYPAPLYAQEVIKFKYTPAYSGAPASLYNICAKLRTSGNNDRCILAHSSTGGLAVYLIDGSGSLIYNAQSIGGSWSPTSGQEYEFEFTADSTNGVLRVFIDGTLHGTLSPGAWTRGSVAGRVHLGSAGSLVSDANGSFGDLIHFNATQNTSSYTAGYTVPEYIYTETTVDLPAFSYSDVGSIQSLDSFTSTEQDAPRFIIDDMYWDGSSWVSSDGSFSQASTEAQVNSNISSLSANGNMTVNVSVVFQSQNDQGLVSNLEIGHTGQQYAASGSLKPAQGISARSLSSYSHTESTDADTRVKLTIENDGTDKYWDGSAWIDSDETEAQTNTLAEVSSNISKLDLGENSTVKVNWFLYTDDQQKSPEISTASITYTFGGIVADPATCNVYGYLKDLSGTPISDAKVKFELARKGDEYYKSASDSIINGSVTKTTSSDGYFQANLIRSSEYRIGSQEYIVTVTLANGDKITRDRGDKINFFVPDADNKNITGLI